MIRKLVFWMAIGMCCFACNNDDEVTFDVPVEFQQISFEPVPGGAIMHYQLPKNLDIFGVRARYVNAYGETLLKDGNYLVDTLLLDGFTEAKEQVPVQLTFFNSEMVESEPLELTFDTEASATVALFNDLMVNPFWGGFNVTYSAPETVDGTIHVFYVGVNPLTQQPDSILMGSYPITQGGDTLNFVPQQDMDSFEVVVRTDDYDGHRVKLEVFSNIPSLTMDTLLPSDFDFSFTGTIQEMPEYGFGVQYLFDGKKKGDGFRSHFRAGNDEIYDTFMAGPEAFGERFIFDLREPKVPAALYGYAFLNFGTYYPYPSGSSYDPYLAQVWKGYYNTRLPCKVKVYGTNENPESVDLASCALLYSLDDDPSWTNWRDNSWCWRADNGINGGRGENCSQLSDAEFNEVEPIVLEMLCNYTGEEFRYLILVVEDTYCDSRNGNIYYEENPDEYVTFDEIEVLVKAE